MGEMLLLVLFAVLAGAGTALTPCVLPVLPALLSASATGGRRRPLGIVLGLVVTHTLAIVALATLIDGVGLADGTVRTLAVAGAGPVRRRAAVAGAPATGSSDRCRGWRASARGPPATGSGRASWWVGRWASSTRRARGRSWRPWCRWARPRAPRRARGGRASATASARARCCGLMASAAGASSIASASRPRPGASARARPRARRSPRSRWPPISTCASRPRWPTSFPPSPPTRRARSSARTRSRTGWPTCAASRGSRPSRRRRPGRPHAVRSLPVLGTAPDFTGNEAWFNTPRPPASLGDCAGGWCSSTSGPTPASTASAPSLR